MKTEKLTKFLLKKHLITEYEINSAMRIHEECGSGLHNVLLSEGYINSYNLYSAIAEFENCRFADLHKEPCDPLLLDPAKREKYISLKAIPWKIEKDKTLIATSEISDDVMDWAKSEYAENYSIVITSPFDICHAVNDNFARENDKDARENLWLNNPECSAKQLFAGYQSKVFLLALLLCLGAIIKFPYEAFVYAFLAVNAFYVATLLFKTLLFVIGISTEKQMSKDCKLIDAANKDLPVYTILVPVYHESDSLQKLVKAIKHIDYPMSKLDVKIIVEADDELTINAFKALKCERNFEMIKVPHSSPKTKPKACNYALRFAKGEFVTIYDAEDIPDPQQLKKVLYQFSIGGEGLVCVQSRLNYFNREENLLTRMFAIEYSNLFDCMLFGLYRMGIPIPLGGTSNHFKIAKLNELYAWDPYNVTEDADLGIRLAQKGWKTTIIDSVTMEEAPISFGAWIKQRSRWIKGHMQTYFVHMRKPLKLLKSLGITGFFGFQFFLGAPALIFLISPVMWGVWLLFLAGIIDPFLIAPAWFDKLTYLSFSVLMLGVLAQVFYAIVAIRKNKWAGMMPYSLIYPFYWVLHSIASFRSLYQLITKPHYWEKTKHGVSSFIGRN